MYGFSFDSRVLDREILKCVGKFVRKEGRNSLSLPRLGRCVLYIKAYRGCLVMCVHIGRKLALLYWKYNG